MKKLISIILATIIISGILTSLPVFAASTDEIEPTSSEPIVIEPVSEAEATAPTETRSDTVTTTTQPTTTEVQPTTPVKPSVVKVTSISIKSYLHIKIGKKKAIKATVKPTNATNRRIKWKSSNTKVAKVTQSGKVTARKAGACTITAAASDGSKKTSKCFIIVGKLANKITLNKTKATLYNGYTMKLSAEILPKAAAYKNVKWTTSNSKVATVNQNGKVTGIKEGKATIKATTTDGSKKSGKCKVTVKNVDDKIVMHSEVTTPAFMKKLCDKLNKWYKKYGATIDPSIVGCDSWYYTDTTGSGWIEGIPQTPEYIKYFKGCDTTFNEIYINTLDLWLRRMSYDNINNGLDWAGIKGYDYKSYNKWLDNLTPKLVLNGNKNGMVEYLKYCRVYCYPERKVNKYGEVNYTIYFYNIGDVEPDEK